MAKMVAPIKGEPKRWKLDWVNFSRIQAFLGEKKA